MEEDLASHQKKVGKLMNKNAFLLDTLVDADVPETLKQPSCK